MGKASPFVYPGAADAKFTVITDDHFIPFEGIMVREPRPG
jgi:hypothetical protein